MSSMRSSKDPLSRAANFPFGRYVGMLLSTLTIVAGGSLPVFAHDFQTPHDTIPNFAEYPTIESDRDGDWSSPKTWGGSIPGPKDIVAVRHIVTVTDAAVASVIGIRDGALLRFGPSHQSPHVRLQVGTLLVEPGATLEAGTPDAPIPAQFSVEIVISDQPLDLEHDPHQFGTGLVSLGKVTMHGSVKEPTFLRVADSDPIAGSKTLTLEKAVTGWRVGDRLILPDTRPARYTRGHPEDLNHEILEIEKIEGNVITLAVPLAYDHPGARNPDKELEFLPHVGNLTRNVVIRSENPEGTRGHVMCNDPRDPRAEIDIRYVQFNDLGRTSASEPIDNVNNHIGRYPLHMHHVMGPLPSIEPRPSEDEHQFRLVGNALANGPKWGIAIHDSHYGLVQHNVVYDFTGAGIVTEDGSESYNRIDHNFAVKSLGGGFRMYHGVEMPFVEPRNPDLGPVDLGFEGSPFWFRGTNNDITHNVSAGSWRGDYDVGGAGFMVFQWNGNVGFPDLYRKRIPRFRGADTAREGDYDFVAVRYLPMRSFTGNETYGGKIGYEFWVPDMSPGFTMTDNVSWHNDEVSFHKYTLHPMTIDGLIARGYDGGEGGIDDQTGPAWVLKRLDMRGLG